MNNIPQQYQQQILLDKLQGTLDESHTLSIANAAVAIIAYLLFKTQGNFAFHVWIAVFLIITLIELFIMQRHKVNGIDQNKLSRYANEHVVFAVIYGVLWGVFTVIAFHASESYLSLLIGLTCGVIAGSITSSAMYLPIFFYFSLPFGLSLFACLLFSGNSSHQLFSVLILVYLAMCSSITFILNRSINETFVLRYEKENILAELAEQKELAEQANLAKSKFLAASSHDLRQPLHALIFFIDALQYGDKPDPQLFPKIERCINGLEELFTALLDISKLDKGDIQINHSHFHLQELISELESEFHPLATEKGLAFDLSKQDVVVYSSKPEVRRIIANLLSNAIRYTEQGSITLNASMQGDNIRLSVVDTGVGIPESVQDDIFEEFVQLHNPERDRSKGLGLGLAIVKRLSQLLDVPVELTSSTEQGSCFSILLPKGEKQKVISTQQSIPNSTFSSLANKKIVVIDDEKDIQDAMAQTLNHWGCEVLVAGSADEAITNIRESRFEFDLIISDLRLRDNKTGVQAIEEITQVFDCSDIPSLLITGDIDPEKLQEVKQKNHTILQKPLKPSVLCTQLKQLLNS